MGVFEHPEHRWIDATGWSEIADFEPIFARTVDIFSHKETVLFLQAKCDFRKLTAVLRF